MQNKLVSIIIVNWNGYEDTFKCIESLQNLDYHNYNIILVDNNSSEPIDDILFHFPNVNLVKNKENLGFAGANNIGIQIALENEADYIWLLNNDTIVKSDSLSTMISCISTNESIGIVCPKIYYYDNPEVIWYGGGVISWARGTTLHLGMMKNNSPLDNEEFPEVNFATGCSMLIKKQLILDVGLMNEDYFLYFEDTDFCCKTIKSGYKVVYNSNSIIWHKVSASTSKNAIKDYYFTRNNLYFMVKHAPKIYYLLFVPFFLKRNMRYLSWLLFKKNTLLIIKKLKHFIKVY
ncbi:glycosyltransferase [Niallia nealsonii AAU1]|nr:glycosyltransferase [Niallia nealsonii AAU1]